MNKLIKSFKFFSKLIRFSFPLFYQIPFLLNLAHFLIAFSRRAFEAQNIHILDFIENLKQGVRTFWHLLSC